jgi:23S rRNA (cytosine1962-C5)-methyltransferase
MKKLVNSLKKQLNQRLTQAFEQREKYINSNERENLYLVFGEADQLPGLLIQKFGNIFLIQYYCHFWKDYQKNIIGQLKQTFLSIAGIYVQTRGEKTPPKPIGQNTPAALVIEEFGVKYQLRFQMSYDIGIYTDMSSIRKKVLRSIQSGGHGLNLFCYTGAFSLAPMLLKNCSVTSVDLSKNYLEWLDQNLIENGISSSQHHSVQADCGHYLQKLKVNQFDWIVCDPPTSSSNKKNRGTAFGFL